MLRYLRLILHRYQKGIKSEREELKESNFIYAFKNHDSGTSIKLLD